jgi:hypothetical protein
MDRTVNQISLLHAVVQFWCNSGVIHMNLHYKPRHV